MWSLDTPSLLWLISKAEKTSERMGLILFPVAGMAGSGSGIPKTVNWLESLLPTLKVFLLQSMFEV